MNTYQIKSALENNAVTKKFFSGVYSYDTILSIQSKPKLVICNTDPSYKIGSHWVLFFFKGNTVDFFDSLGKSISSYGVNFVKFVKKFAKYYNISHKAVQKKTSKMCGKYCLYYSYIRCKGYKMSFIINNIPHGNTVGRYVNRTFKIL